MGVEKIVMRANDVVHRETRRGRGIVNRERLLAF